MAEFARNITGHRLRLAQVERRLPSIPPDTSDLDADWSDEPPAPRESFIALKTTRALPRVPVPPLPRPAPAPASPRLSLAPAAPLLTEIVYDVWDSPRAMLVLVELPGVEADEVRLTLGSHTLYLDLEVRSQRPGIASGRHRLSIEMPGGLAAEALDASLANGVLRVHVSKAHSGPRSVPIASKE